MSKIRPFKKITNPFVFSISIIAVVFFAGCMDSDGNLTYKIRVDAKDFLVEEPPLKTLVGTEWKLVAFVDVENNTSRPPIYGQHPYIDDCYTIYFDSVGSEPYWHCDYPTFFTGFADHNDILAGCYFANYADLTFQVNKPIMTTAVGTNVENDEKNFLAGLRDSEEFELTTKHLKLFYNNKKNYLLFNRIN